MNDDDRWIWISRWEEFQHYKPERDRGPAWLKTYVKQLSDSRYLNLTDRQRALLHDLRMIFAMTSCRVPYGNVTGTSRESHGNATGQSRERHGNATAVSRYRHRQTFRSDMDALNHAGFIEYLSRDGLENRLDLLYASRAPARSKEKEVEKEEEQTPTPGLDNGHSHADEPVTVWQDTTPIDWSNLELLKEMP